MSSDRAQRIWRRTRVGGSLAGAVALLLWLSSASFGPALVLAVAVAAAAAGVFEAARLGLLGARGEPRAPIAGWVALAGAAIFLWGVRSGDAPWMADLSRAERFWIAVLGAAGAAVALGTVAAAPALQGAPANRRGPGVVRLAGALLWLTVPLPLLYVVRLDLGTAGLAALIVLSKVGDIAGYYVGSALGGRFPHHPFPNVSPNKTAVGCWASLAAGTLCGLLLQALGALPEARLGALSGLLAGALVNVAAQAGDLLESRVKRAAGVKDSGETFGPSGGMLDLVDSLLLSVPAAVVTWPLLFRWPFAAA